MAGNSNVTLPTSTSYSPLLDGPNNGVPSNWRPKKKLLLLIFSGFIALAVIFISTKDPNVSSNQLLSSSKQNHGSSKEPKKLVPLSRGKPAGVSEKSNRLSADPNFSWNNSMLTWQRTAFHFQPEKNWMNDPNGPLYYKGWYHFFYQYNPNSAIWGNIVWGHAVSKDMIHWLHLPLAMVADQWYDVNGVWSGSATILPNDKVVMLYTGSTNESVQVQNLAYPSDPFDPLLIKWEKYSKNPVLIPPPGILDQDFRDPTTAWLTKEGKWRIVIGSKVNKTGISFVYDTEDFKTYTRLDGFLHAVPGTGIWECVDFFPVSLADDKQGVDTSANGPGLKHVVKASLDDDRHDYYAIGTYDESTGKWVPDDPKVDVGIGIRYDYGIFYASKTFYDQTKHRRVLWGWICESDSEYADVKKGWASVQSMPRTIVLDKKTGNYLLQWPVEEAESLRLSSKTFENIEVKPGSVLPLDVGPATQLDIVAEFELNKKALERVVEANTKFNCSASGGVVERGALGPFGFLVLADEKLTEKTPVYFYVVKGADGNLKTHFCSDQKRSSSANDVKKDIYGSIVPVLSDEKLSLRILIDHSIVESFAQGGRIVITSRVYPTKAIYGAAKLFMFNNATEASVTANLKVWQMNSAFIRPFHPNKNYADASRIS